MTTFKHIIDNIDDSLIILDSEGLIEFANRSFYRLLHHDKDELVGKSPLHFIESSHKDEFQQHLNESRIDNTDYFHTGWVRKDGTTLSQATLIRNLPDEENESAGKMILITGALRLEIMRNEILRFDERFRDFVENIEELLFGLDEQGDFTYASPASSQVLGYSPPELISSSIMEIICEQSRNEIRNALQLLNEGSAQSIEIAVNTKQRGIKWMRTSIRPIYVDDKVVGARGVMMDVSDQKAIFDALKENEARYRNLIEKLPDSILVLQDDIILFSNAAANLLLETSSTDTLIGLSILDYAHSESEELLRQLLTDASKKQTQIPLTEIKFVNSDGNEVFAELTLFPVSYYEKQAVQAVFRDISERKLIEDQKLEVEARRKEAQKAESLSMLAGGVAHDFNNLLTSILANTQLAIKESQSSLPVKKILETIENSTRRAAVLTEKMLAFTGQIEFNKILTDLPNLTITAASEWNSFQKREYTIKWEIARDLPEVAVDRKRVKEIIRNLLDNAAESVSNRVSKILVRIGSAAADREYLASFFEGENLKEGEYLFIEINDDGGGIKKEVLPRIFDPFFTTKFTGRGMGLSTVLGIAKSHSGSVKVTSSVLGGTQVTVIFPLFTSYTNVNSVGNEADVTKSILLIDNNLSLANQTSLVLTQFGYNVLTATTGRQGIEKYKRNTPVIGVVLIDLTMPGLNGDEAYQKIREIKEDGLLVLISRYSESEAKEMFLGYKFDGYLQKPYTVKELLKVLNDLPKTES